MDVVGQRDVDDVMQLARQPFAGEGNNLVGGGDAGQRDLGEQLFITLGDFAAVMGEHLFDQAFVQRVAGLLFKADSFSHYHRLFLTVVQRNHHVIIEYFSDFHGLSRCFSILKTKKPDARKRSRASGFACILCFCPAA